MNKRARTLTSSENMSQKRGRIHRNEAVGSSESCDRSTDIEAAATKEDDVAKRNSQTTSGHYQWRLTRQKKNIIHNENSSQPAGEKVQLSHGGPGNLDVLPSDKPGEASLVDHQAEATRLTRRNDTSKHNNSPSLFSWLQCPHHVFHSFESKKSEDKLEEGQIWAMYGSDNGGLPINELPFGCGSFKLRTGETKIYETSRRFSHQVTAVAWTGDQYSFFPWNGQVWAIFKNWSAEWTLTDLKHCEYELVEVLEYDFHSAVYRVLVLEVVDGFRMIYKRAGIKVDINQTELLRFSHCVPSFHLTEERGGNLRGYFLLDPAAMPDSKQDKVEEKNISEQRAREGKQEKKLEGVGDEYGKLWVQRCPKLFALFNPKPHYGTIIGVSECYLGLMRSSLWWTLANLVKEVAHLDSVISDSQLASLTNQMKALKEAGFAIKIFKNWLKALAFQAQQTASAALEALDVAKASAPSMECLEAAVAAEIEMLELEDALAEARRKLKAAKAQHQALREQKIAMDAKDMEIEVSRHELDVAEEHLSQVSQL
ncbi:hypothetical protein MRB53_010759 [Persea americana]|uniref:Uncharacterized protein n=1 Tax=Persea americana TaxID=3435 RepID=A0ACC2LSR7_PERAE|nr:hypothetical protein MRB53_010759 [Persea americana]